MITDATVGAVLPDFFRLEEFVHPKIFELRGSNSIQLVSAFQINFASEFRRLSDAPLRINNWHLGGNLRNRGTRPRWELPKGGGQLSQHYLSNALDSDSNALTVKQSFELIHDNFDLFFDLGVRVIEDIRYTPTWLHVDCRLLWPDQIKQIKYSRKFMIVTP